jgi:hypothetical protein
MHCYTLTELIKFPYYKKPVKNEAKESILEKKGVMSLHAPQSRNRGGAFLPDVAITVYHIVRNYHTRLLRPAFGPLICSFFMRQEYSIPNGPGTISSTKHNPKKHGTNPALGTINSA